MMHINDVILTKEQIATMFIDMAVEAIEISANFVPIEACIRRYGSKFVWKYAGNTLHRLGVMEEKLTSNDVEFLYEEHDMEN